MKRIVRTRTVIILFLLTVLAVSGTGLLKYRLASYRNQQVQERLVKLAFPATEEQPSNQSPVDFEALQAVNPDVVGWIRIPGTQIDYPILQDADDNEKYLHTDFEGNESVYGAIYLDCESESDFSGWNHPIYGHHMKDGSMFRDVVRFREPEYFQEHAYFEIYTPERTIHLKAVSCYYTSSDGIVRETKFGSREAYDVWLKERLELCAYAELPEVPVGAVFTLVTCSYEQEDARTLLFAVEVDEEGNVIPADSEVTVQRRGHLLARQAGQEASDGHPM